MTAAFDAALEYARKGWSSFPLVGKRPATKNGFKDATTDREQLRAWFVEEGYTNLGIAIPEGYWVLDVDPRNGGDESFDQIRDQLPGTKEATTGGGGLHLWYRGEAPEIRLPGIDIKKGGKGYVVAPPSIHPDTGKPYQWSSVFSRERAVTAFSGPLETAPGNSIDDLFTGSERGSGGVWDLVESTDPIPHGQQHDTLVQIAGHVLAMYPPAIARKLYDEAVSRCEPAHPEREAERIWEWTLRRQAQGDGLVRPDGEPEEAGLDEAGDGEVPPGGREELKRLKAREWAMRQSEEEAAKGNPIPIFVTARDLLTQEEEELSWRIHKILPIESVAVLHAGAKVGKSHVVGHMVHSMLTGEDFLGHWGTTKVEDRNIVLVDLELSERVLRSWTEKFKNDSDRLRIASLRGNSRAMDILSDAHFARVVEAIKSQDPGVLIIDPLGPMLGAQGIEENDNGAVRRLLDRLMDLKQSAEVGEMIVSHHAGHGSKSRTRGASVFMDWPDVMIGLRRKNEEDLSSPRILSAYGRDVNLPNTELSFDPITQVLSVAEVQESDSLVLAFVTQHPGSTREDIQEELKRLGQAHSASHVHRVIKELIDDGSIREERGTGRGSPKAFFPNDPLS